MGCRLAVRVANQCSLVARHFHRRTQGDLGEVAAIAWLTKVGAIVSQPLFHSPDYDLVAELGGDLLRVQVKTSTGYRKGRFAVRLATSGGNRSWNRIVRHFDPARCDYLFVLIGDGRRWFIPAIAIDGRTSINLGGPKYAEFEVHPKDSTAFAIERPLESREARGSADVGESGETVNLVPLAEWVRIPPPPLNEPPNVAEATSAEAALGVRRRPTARAKISPGHQVTIPVGPFAAAKLKAGDRFLVRAEGEGRVSFARIGPNSQNGSAA